MAVNAFIPTRRPLALRTQSVDESWRQSELETEISDGHVRRKSQYTASSPLPLSMRRSTRRFSGKSSGGRPSSGNVASLNAVQERTGDERSRSSLDGLEALTPPITPLKSGEDTKMEASGDEVELQMYDFSRIDYELDRAKAIGSGRWSNVFWAQPIAQSPGLSRSPLTPPATPEKVAGPPSSLYAVKLPARPDSKDIFVHEARMLTRLQQSRYSHHYIVPFHGLDPRSTALVFEAVLGGSLEGLVARLSVVTELARHLDIRSIFASLASDLASGLSFIHSSGAVHADIKPANILLDITEDTDDPRPTLRARYIDFSASFVVGQDSLPNAGGTWDYMAPEQLRIQKNLSMPTFASDIWSVGATLLYVLAGGSPYAAACAPNNAFMLREAIKSGDPLGFARMDPVVRKRMAACQDFVDCCRLALQKDRAKRISAEAWERWIVTELIGDD